jgi:hypothetical protein
MLKLLGPQAEGPGAAAAPGRLSRAGLGRVAKFISPQAGATRLRVAPSADSHEGEADRHADAFVQAWRASAGPTTREPTPTPGASVPLPASIRSVAEPHYRRDLGGVRVHVDPAAADAVHARAFTIGDAIVFNRGEYAPHTAKGRHLIAHELGHVAQQRSRRNAAQGTAVLQRRTYRGSDTGGTYVLDDRRCELEYRARWFFTFETSQTPAQQRAYMAAAKTQIESHWSQQMPLIPDGEGCSCHPDGITVRVVLAPRIGQRRGPGFSITVSDRNVRAFVNPLTRGVDLDVGDEPLSDVGTGPTFSTFAHEFGHTIELADEYSVWASMFRTHGARDRVAIMHRGTTVRPRHYQHFADLVNLEFGGGCTYWPNGVRQPSYAQPVNRWSGLPFGFLPSRSDFLIGVNFDRRLSNTPLLGLFYPQVGLSSIWNPRDRTTMAGPTVGLTLSRVAYPLYVDLRTGVFFDPQNPASVPDIRIPLLVDLGVHTEGFRAGVNYTAVRDVLGRGPWTHIVGVGLSVPLE